MNKELKKRLKEKWKAKVLLYISLAGVIPPVFYMVQGFSELGVDEFFNRYPWGDILFGIAHSIFITLASAVVSMSIITWLQITMPWEKSVLKRLVAELVLTCAGVSVIMVIAGAWYIGAGMHQFSMNDEGIIFRWIATGIIMNVTITTFYEGYYFLQKWKLSIVKAERLEKENLVAQFEVLKTQVNPHFLFNSLNVLSSLVHEDADKAELFIDEFSSVYRYLLEIHNKESVSLQEELEVVDSYIYLQSIRFGKGVFVAINIADELKEKQIPPLAIQLCVENAIKHNAISEDSPLSVEVRADVKEVVVENNLQPRINVKSTGKGLANLKKRYKLFSEYQPDFYKNDTHFVARLPFVGN